MVVAEVRQLLSAIVSPWMTLSVARRKLALPEDSEIRRHDRLHRNKLVYRES
jgi:hypothetical protein